MRRLYFLSWTQNVQLIKNKEHVMKIVEIENRIL